MSSMETYKEIGITVENSVTAVKNISKPTTGLFAGLNKIRDDVGSFSEPSSRYQYFCSTQNLASTVFTKVCEP